MGQKINLFWHRRDLRLEDNAGLHAALKSEQPLLCLFIFDKSILDKLSAKDDARVTFIHRELSRVKAQLEDLGSTMLVRYGHLQEVFEQLLSEYEIESVFTNRDYEPYAQERDKQMYSFFKDKGIQFKGYKDHVIFEKSEVVKDDGSPYTVFTPYMKKWKKALTQEDLQTYPVMKYSDKFLKIEALPLISLEEMGFEPTNIEFPDRTVEDELLAHYGDRRDIPSIQGTSRLSIHLRFGTLSIRTLARKGMEHSEKWLNELIWRDFYQMLIFHFPHSVESAFRPKYDGIPWSNNAELFDRWCKGKTGYPIVDAGMRELNATGFMHNRVRMIVASFLTKHLLIDWKWGERYFAEKLLDFELASNVGGWQWAASSGADAAPYFRVFNPTSQEKKFDPERKYIKRWVPEVGTPSYPDPIVDHKAARQHAIDVFKEHLS